MSGRDLMMELKAGVVEKAIAHIVYTDGQGRVSERDIVPVYTYTLVNRDTGETLDYTMAGCFKANAFHSFQLDRIQYLEWNGLGWTNGVKMLFSQRAFLAGKEPKILGDLTAKDLEALDGNWGEEPMHLLRYIRRRLFVRECMGAAY